MSVAFLRHYHTFLRAEDDTKHGEESAMTNAWQALLIVVGVLGSTSVAIVALWFADTLGFSVPPRQ